MRILNNIVLLLIKGYRRFISPMFPPTCKFTPTCSVYSYQAFQKYNFLKALYLSIIRVAKCNPFHPGGDDPLS
ncbi:MAG: membrane protein insertion efficiency factor YidD [Candidatus Cloacimonetes bacterium]|nr:membrane protein insertion efficiency factor YidD [Candidatus Cloacimonadota bacterium]